MTSRTAKTATRLLFASSAIVLSMVSPAKADPSWSDISQQAGTFTKTVNNPTTLTITQTSERAVGYANNLSIRASDTVNIIQQAGDGSLFVAKANSRDFLPSVILGKLSANGNVMVLDGNGVLFGQNAMIDVGGIIASTGSIDNADVMDGKFDITGSGSLFNTGVVNNAIINVKDAGLVAFVAPTVVNNGVINAKLGRVALASGDRVTVDLRGDNLVEVALDSRQSSALLKNDGVINAQGGTVQMTAETARGIVNNVINMDGVIDVTSVRQSKGKIILGGGNANVNVKGKLTADKGGSVDVQANNITVDKDAVVSATGNGGSIRFMALSNGFTSVRLPSLRRPFFVDVPVTNGSGSYNGTMTAGGQVETSATTSLFINENLKVTANDWLIDPINITIDNGMATALMFALNANTNTTILTNAPGSDAGDITLNNGVNITWNTAAKLSLVADNNVLLNGKINSNFEGTGTQGAVNIKSNGSFTIAGTGLIETNGGNVKIDNKGIYTATTDSVRTSGTGKIEINQADGGSLQNAINSIRNTGSGWNTLNVFAGNFAENININQDNFLLSGVNAGVDANAVTRNVNEAVINAAVDTSAAITSVNKKITVDGMKIVGGKEGINFTGDDGRVLNNIIENQIGMGVNFKGVDNGVISRNLFKGQGSNAAQSTFANSISFKNNVVENGGASGLIASRVAEVEVLRNTVTNVAGEGIGVFNYTTANIDNNTVVDADGIGIRAQYGSDQLDITKNNITNSGYDGVLVNGAKNVNVSNNIINDSGNGIDDGGIVLRAVQSAIVNKNNIDKTGWYGIAADGVNKAVITNNTINATGGQGIFNRNSKFDGVEPSVLISGNTITNTGGTGISLTKFLNAQVINNTVDTTGTFGIWATGEFSSLSSDDSRVLIESNTVSNNQQNAIRVNNVQDITITDNTADKTRYMGVRVHDFDTASISKNNVTNTGLSGIDVRNGITSLLLNKNTVNGTGSDGVYISNVNNADIRKNTVFNTRDDGIEAVNLTDAEIVNNTVYNTGDDGVVASGGSDIRISGNTVRNVRDDGVLVSNASDVRINDNEVYSLGGDGIEVSNLTNGDILDNVVYNVGDDGIVSTGGSDLRISRNTVRDLGDDGIFVSNASDVRIKNNKAYNLGGDGINTINLSGSIIKENEVYFLGGNGIVSTNGDDVTVSLNTVRNLGGDGIAFSNTINSIISGNTVRDLGGNGISTNGGSSVTINGLNDVRRVGKNGISSNGTGNVLVQGNEVRDTVMNGIYAANAGGISILDNFVRRSSDNGIYVTNSYGESEGPSVLIQNNNVRNTDENGIYVNGFSRADVLNNVVADADDNGIRVNGQSEWSMFPFFFDDFGYNGVANVNGNNVNNSDENGISVSNVHTARIRDNTVNNSGWDGINLYGFDIGRIRDNTVTRSDYNGISAYNGFDLLVRDNNVDRSGNDGIAVAGITDRYIFPEGDGEGFIPLFEDEGDGEVFGSFSPSRLRVINNTVDRSGDDGIDIAYAQHVVVRGNDVNRSGFGDALLLDEKIIEGGFFKNTANGIIVVGSGGYWNEDLSEPQASLEGSWDVSIINNRVRNSENNGVAVSGYDDADIINNRVRNSGDNGLYVFGPRNGNVNVEENTFTDNDIGAQFESGLIDFTGIGNEFINGRVGLRFSPYQSPFLDDGDDFGLVRVEGRGPKFIGGPVVPLRLVDNDGPGSSAPGVAFPTNFGGTIGEQLFDGQTQYFVELANGAFFEPGRYTWLNGLNSTYRMGDGTLFRPSTVGGILNADQLAFLESRFFHNVDDATLGRFFFGALPEINQEDIFNQFNPFAFGAGNVRVTILGLPRLPGGGGGVGAGGVNLAGLLNNLTPNAGGDDNSNVDVSSLTPEMLNQIEAAAGGDGADSEGSNNTGGGAGNTACWNDASVGAQQGQVTTISFGGELGASSIETANNCRNK